MEPPAQEIRSAEFARIVQPQELSSAEINREVYQALIVNANNKGAARIFTGQRLFCCKD